MTDGTLALLVRILLRYVAGPFAIWLGLPPEMASELVSHPDTLALALVVVGGIAGIVEAWTAWARRRGGKT